MSHSLPLSKMAGEGHLERQRRLPYIACSQTPIAFEARPPSLKTTVGVGTDTLFIVPIFANKNPSRARAAFVPLFGQKRTDSFPVSCFPPRFLLSFLSFSLFAAHFGISFLPSSSEADSPLFCLNFPHGSFPPLGKEGKGKSSFCVPLFSLPLFYGSHLSLTAFCSLSILPCSLPPLTELRIIYDRSGVNAARENSVSIWIYVLYSICCISRHRSRDQDQVLVEVICSAT